MSWVVGKVVFVVCSGGATGVVSSLADGMVLLDEEFLVLLAEGLADGVAGWCWRPAGGLRGGFVGGEGVEGAGWMN